MPFFKLDALRLLRLELVQRRNRNLLPRLALLRRQNARDQQKRKRDKRGTSQSEL